jgi:CheY-like chemotaxis protein
MAAAEANREQLLEAERFARSEAERASRLKDEFLATLSHELRTPLNAIVGWAHILKVSATDPALTPAIDTIARNARAQVKLIEDLLDMSRIVSGKIELTVTRCRLADIVTTAADALQPVASARGVTLSVSVEDAANAWVAGDTARLHQVVTNLLDNGIKFTPEGGIVEVRLRADGTHVQLTVRDTGQGISAEFLPAVFDRFRQADGSTTRRHGGLGLGLSIAKQIVELHDGTIAVHSDGDGLGSLFTVTLPLAGGAADEDASAEPAEPIVLAGVRVLVVDDDTDARDLLRRVLAEQGCVVAGAASAQEALRELETAPWDVLLTDIGMPGTDGYELLARVRGGTHGRIRALAVTAFARAQDREKALAAGFDGHLSKPIDPAQLLRAIGRLMAQ